MRIVTRIVVSALGLLLAAAVRTASAQPVLLAPLPEKPEALLSPGQKAYLDLPLAERRRWLVDTNLYARLTKAGWRPRKVRLAWRGAADPVSVCVGKGGKTVFKANDLDVSSIEVGNLEVGEHYDWSVRDAQGGRGLRDDRAGCADVVSRGSCRLRAARKGECRMRLLAFAAQRML